MIQGEEEILFRNLNVPEPAGPSGMKKAVVGLTQESWGPGAGQLGVRCGPGAARPAGRVKEGTGHPGDPRAAAAPARGAAAATLRRLCLSPRVGSWVRLPAWLGTALRSDGRQEPSLSREGARGPTREGK